MITLNLLPKTKPETGLLRMLCMTLIFSVALWLTGCDKADKIQLSISSLEFLFSDTEQTFTINSNTSWVADINSDITWLTITPSSGTGNGTVTVTVAPNPSAAPRTATVTVSGGDVSQTFTVTQTGAPPTLSVSATSLEFAHTTEEKTFTLSSNTTWTVGSSETAWLTVSPTSGTNDSTITVTAAANPAKTERTATVTVSGDGINHAIDVKQAGVPDFLTVSPAEINIAPSNPAGTTYPLTVESNTDWTVTKGSETWFTLTPASGSDNGTVQITAQNNNTASQRTATVTVSGGGITRTVTLTQIAAGLNLSQSTLSFLSTAGTQVVSITSNISWTAVSNQTWLSVLPSSGSDSNTITVAVAANSTTSQRTGTITVSGNGINRTIAVTQAGVSFITLSPALLTFTAGGGNNTFSVSSNVSWTVDRGSATWLTVSSSTGSNNSTITVTAAAHTATSPRTAEITVTGDGISRTVTVTQAGYVAASLSVLPASLNFAAAGESNTLTVTSNTSWTITGIPSWLTVSPSSGSGTATATVTAASNATSTSARYATLTITAGSQSQQVTVSQSPGGLLVFGNGITAAGSFGGGNGLSGSPYLINTAQELKKLVDDVNGGNSYANTHFRLTADIHVTANEWIPIGSQLPVAFRGVFNGNDRTITGSLRSGTYVNFGFFGHLGVGASISNLTIAAAVQNTRDYSAYTGGIAGFADDALIMIDNCLVTGSVTGGNGGGDCATGGIIGFGLSGTIQNCRVTSHITGATATFSSMTGGIAGYWIGNITNCMVTSTAMVTGGTTNDVYCGGIVGYFLPTSNMTNCTNHASVLGVVTGGLAGHNSGTIHTSLNTGPVTGSSNVGGLAGSNTNMASFPDAFIYSCCTNTGPVNGGSNEIGYGKAVEDPCPAGHTKR